MQLLDSSAGHGRASSSHLRRVIPRGQRRRLAVLQRAASQAAKSLAKVDSHRSGGDGVMRGLHAAVADAAQAVTAEAEQRGLQHLKEVAGLQAAVTALDGGQFVTSTSAATPRVGHGPAGLERPASGDQVRVSLRQQAKVAAAVSSKLSRACNAMAELLPPSDSLSPASVSSTDGAMSEEVLQAALQAAGTHVSKAARGVANLRAAGLPLSPAAESYIAELQDLTAERLGGQHRVSPASPEGWDAAVEGGEAVASVGRVRSLRVRLDSRVRKAVKAIRKAKAEADSRRQSWELSSTDNDAGFRTAKDIHMALVKASATAQELELSGFSEELIYHLQKLNSLGESLATDGVNGEAQPLSGYEAAAGLDSRMQESVERAVRMVEEVERSNAAHQASVAAMSPEEAARLLETQEAQHQAALQSQLRLLQAQMAEASVIARDMEQAGLGGGDLVNDLQELRSQCVALGASEAAMEIPQATAPRMRGARATNSARQDMERLMASALRTFEEVERSNAAHQASLAAMSPEEAAHLLEAQEAQHQTALQSQLRLLQAQMAEASAIARDMEEAGLGGGDLVRDLQELRSQCVALGASEAAMKASGSARMRGSRAVPHEELHMRQLLNKAVLTVENVERGNAAHQASVAAMTPEEAARVLAAQEAQHRASMQSQLRLLQAQMAEAAAVAKDMEEAGLGGGGSLLKDLEELRSQCVALGASEAAMKVSVGPRMRGSRAVRAASLAAPSRVPGNGQSPEEAKRLLQQLMNEAALTMEDLGVHAAAKRCENVSTTGVTRSVEEAAASLAAQEAQYRQEVAAQLRLLQSQIAEATSIARDMDESGLAELQDSSSLLRDLEEMRAQCAALGSGSADGPHLLAGDPRHGLKRGSHRAFQGRALQVEARSLLDNALRSVERVQEANSAHQLAVSALSPSEAADLLRDQQEKHEREMGAQLRLLQAQVAEAAAVARELQEAGLISSGDGDILAELEAIRAQCVAMGAAASAMDGAAAPRSKERAMRGSRRNAEGPRGADRGRDPADPAAQRLQCAMNAAALTMGGMLLASASVEQARSVSLSPSEAARRLAEQEAAHQKQLGAQLRLLQAQMAEAMAVAREMEEAGLGGAAGLLEDLREMRQQCLALGASEAAMNPDAAVSAKMRGSRWAGAEELNVEDDEARIRSLVEEAVRTVYEVERHNAAHQLAVSAMSAGDAAEMLSSQEAEHQRVPAGTMAHLQSQISEATAIACELQAAGMAPEGLLRDLEELRSDCVAVLGADPGCLPAPANKRGSRVTAEAASLGTHKAKLLERFREQEEAHKAEVLRVKEAMKAEMAEVARNLMDVPGLSTEAFAEEMAQMEALLEYESGGVSGVGGTGMRGAGKRESAIQRLKDEALEGMKASALALVEAVDSERQREEEAVAGLAGEEREQFRKRLRQGLWEQDHRLRAEYDRQKAAMLSEIREVARGLAGAVPVGTDEEELTRFRDDIAALTGLLQAESVAFATNHAYQVGPPGHAPARSLHLRDLAADRCCNLLPFAFLFPPVDFRFLYLSCS